MAANWAAPASPLLPAQTGNLRGLAFNEGSNKTAPRFKRLAFLICKAVLLINANDSSERTRRVVQNLLDDRQIDAKPRHATRTSAAQIVQTPCRHICRQQSIETALAFTVSTYR